MVQMESNTFYFKQFQVRQDRCAMKVGTDGVLLGAWANVEGCESALDIGTGGGVIALMLAQRAPAAQIHAVEVEQEAFLQARENAAASPWSDRVHVVHQAIQEYARSAPQRYDLLVSNPPFFSGGVLSHNQDRNSVRHTVKLPHGELLTAVQRLIAPQGRFCVILPYIEGLRFVEMAASYHLYCVDMLQVRSKPGKPVERLLMQFEGEERETRTRDLVIHGEGSSDWTEEYKALTRDFYLNM